METQEVQIVSGALQLYLRYGVKSITMDDIARKLAISKKTIYKYVSNKAELVDRSFHHLFYTIEALMEGISNKEANAIDELFKVDDAVCETMKNHHPAMVFQLKKYYPETWRSIDNLRRQHIISSISKNLKKGIKQGLYRDDFDKEIIALLYYTRAELMADEELFSPEKFDLEHLLKENLIYHIRGIASEKGVSYLENKLKQTK